MHKKIVAIGGGTGTYTLLTGLRDFTDKLELTAIATMADDGGSNKVLRDEFGLLPTSGIRQSIVALAKERTTLRALFQYRYSQGTGISGMTFGNLFMAALADLEGSQRAAIKKTCKLLHVAGTILPVSYEHTSLVATYEDGTEVLGEHYIDLSSPKVARQRIARLRTLPKVTIDPEADAAIRAADYIILGPGDLYTNTIANLVVGGVREAIESRPGRVIFVMNLMARAGESYNYQASDYLSDLSRYLSPVTLSHILLNTDTNLSPGLINLYGKEDSRPVGDDLGETWQTAKVTRAKLRSHTHVVPQAGDNLARSIVRHDPRLLARSLLRIFQVK